MPKTISLNLLDRVGVASPCDVSWEEMRGDDRKRFCGRCRLNVYNLSAMTADEAAGLIQGAEGRLCVRLYRRQDGTMITRDCPVGLRGARLRAAAAAGRVAAALALLLGGAAVLGAGRPGSPVKLRQFEPFATLCRWLSPAPAPPARTIMGDVCVMPPKQAPAATTPGVH